MLIRHRLVGFTTGSGLDAAAQVLGENFQLFLQVLCSVAAARGEKQHGCDDR